MAIAALIVLVLNDHWWKAASPGPVTGKLSDVAGLVLGPLALVALLEVVAARVRPDRAPSRRVVAAAVLVVGAVFIAIKTFPPATEAYELGLGLAQWPFIAAGAALRGQAIPEPVHVALVADPTDLLALPALLVPLVLGLRRAADRPDEDAVRRG